MYTIARRLQVGSLAALLTLGAAGSVLAADHKSAATETIQTFKKTDPGLARFFETSAGYAVFSSVGKGGAGVGGAYGRGVLYEKGKLKPTGETSLTQFTVGLQLGGQNYAEIIFFETDKALEDFKNGHFELAAQLSAVALESGASKNARYRDGVAVFTATKKGLMFEGSVGGQKFNYKPFAAKAER